MKVLKCDRCKSEKDVRSKVNITLTRHVYSENERGEDVWEEREITRKYDLCAECAKKIENWICYGRYAHGMKAEMEDGGNG